MSKIDVTGVDIKELIKKAYELSKPQGLGFLHYTPGELTEEEVNDILAKSVSNSRYNKGLHLDYVKGRSLKFHMFQEEDDRVYIYSPWYDHSDAQLKELLDHFGIKMEDEKNEHSLSCNCEECIKKNKKY